MIWELLVNGFGTLATWVGFLAALVTLYLVRNGRQPALAGIRHTALAICCTEITIWAMDMLYWSDLLSLAHFSLYRRGLGRPLLAWIALAFLLWLLGKPTSGPQKGSSLGRKFYG